MEERSLKAALGGVRMGGERQAGLCHFVLPQPSSYCRGVCLTRDSALWMFAFLLLIGKSRGGKEERLRNS